MVLEGRYYWKALLVALVAALLAGLYQLCAWGE